MMSATTQGDERTTTVPTRPGGEPPLQPGERASRLGDLLRRRGVGGEMSLREAERVTSVSREALRKMLRPLRADERRRVETSTLEKIAAGLRLDPAVVRRAAIADWGDVDVAALTDGDTDTDLARILEQVGRLHPMDRITVQMEIARLQQTDLLEAARAADVARPPRPRPAAEDQTPVTGDVPPPPER